MPGQALPELASLGWPDPVRDPGCSGQLACAWQGRMSNAHVRFLTIAGEPTDQPPARFTFRCVKGNKNTLPGEEPEECGNLLIAVSPHSVAHGVPRDPDNRNGGRAQWDWDGDRAAPTFSPSINCQGYCGWHGYIRNGRCVETSGADEPEP